MISCHFRVNPYNTRNMKIHNTTVRDTNDLSNLLYTETQLLLLDEDVYNLEIILLRITEYFNIHLSQLIEIMI